MSYDELFLKDELIRRLFKSRVFDETFYRHLLLNHKVLWIKL